MFPSLKLHFVFIFRMVWREFKKEYSLLLASLLPIVVGVALIVALQSIRGLVLDGLAAERRALMGADLSVSIRGHATPELEELFSKIPGERVREVSFPSMLRNSSAQISKLAQVRGLSGPYPFYGSFEVEPRSASRSFMDGRSILVESTLAKQLKAKVGEKLKLGSKEFRIAGIINKIPGGNEMVSALAPRVYLLDSALAGSELLQYGIRQTTKMHFKFDDYDYAKQIVSQFSTEAQRLGAKLETPDSKREQFGNAIGRVYEFLNLFGVSTLLFGLMGAASGGLQYARSKRRSAAILRCIGAGSNDLFVLYAGTFFIGALIASSVGVLFSIPLLSFLGSIASEVLPVSLGDLVIPKTSAILVGILFGSGASLCFAIPPLWNLRRTSPNEVLRKDLANRSMKNGFGLGFLVVFSGLAFALSSLLGSRLDFASAFALSLCLLVLLQACSVWFLRRVMKRVLPGRLAFPVRQGLMNLSRPGSETLFLATLVGIPFFLLVTLISTSESLRGEFRKVVSENNENLLLFDVQKDQREIIQKVSSQHSVELKGWFPLVSMRLASVKGVPVETLRENKTSSRNNWFLSRQYRNTYRGNLLSNESLIDGRMYPRFVGKDRPIPITLERSMAEKLALAIGDELAFDVQGISMDCYVSGIRSFNWRGVNPGFFVVFPEGVLEDAPQFVVVTAYVRSEGELLAFQEQLGSSVPNVSLIDSGRIIQSIKKIFEKLRLVVRFLGHLALVAALLVILSSVFLSRDLRLKEYRVYHALGASRLKIRLMAVAEFFFIGVVSTFGAGLAALLFNGLVSKYVLKLQMQLHLDVLVIILFSTVGILSLLGLLFAKDKSGVSKLKT